MRTEDRIHVLKKMQSNVLTVDQMFGNSKLVKVSFTFFVREWDPRARLASVTALM